jgi:hypothetical protein
MNNIIFIIPTIGRDSLIHSLESLTTLNGNYKWKALVIFDGLKNNLNNFQNDNIIFIEVNKCGKEDIKNTAGLVRNKGFEYIIENNVKSEYIGFLDDDDTLHPDYIIHLYNEKEKFNFDCIIFRMMFQNYNIIPHEKTNKIIKCNVGISFVIKNNIINKKNIIFRNNPYEDYIFIASLMNEKYKILLSKYVNYFVKTTYNDCKDKIKNYASILFN